MEGAERESERGAVTSAAICDPGAKGLRVLGGLAGCWVIFLNPADKCFHNRNLFY